MIDLSDWLLPYPFIIGACLTVIIGLIMTLRKSSGFDHGITKLMLLAWTWLGLSYLLGWLSVISDDSRVAMLRAGVFILAIATMLHLIELIRVRRINGH